LSTLVLQTISLMLGETEKGAARFSALTSKQRSVTADLLLALVCDPELKPYNCNSTSHTELLFMAYQAQRVVLVLSFLSESPLSPSQAVLLYQRCHLLLTCMQHNPCVNTYIITQLKEEF
ncbi:hypothetical protein DAT39_007647, partial [Clarias magur]